MTIPPHLLSQLARTPYDPQTAPQSYIPQHPQPHPPSETDAATYQLDCEAAYLEGWNKARGGRAPEMFSEAVRIFVGFQEGLEEIVGGVLGAMEGIASC